MADRYDPRSLEDYVSGRLPPGTTVDDSGQLVFRDTGEPVKSNPWKLQRLLQIMGLAVPSARGASTAASAAPTSVDSGMAAANRAIGQNSAKQAIAGPPPAGAIAGPSARDVTEATSSHPSIDLSQMQRRIPEPPAQPVGMPNPSEVLAPPRLVGESTAAEGAAQPWVSNSRANTPVLSMPSRALSRAAPGADPIAAARATAMEMLGKPTNGASAPAPQSQPAPQSIFTDKSYQMPGANSGADFSRRLPADAAPAQAAPTPAPLPPRRPMALPQQHGSANPDFQSNGREVVNGRNLNWGSGDSAADFVRASKALQNDPDLTGYAGGGRVHPEVLHALNIIRRHLGIAAIWAFLVLGPLYAVFSVGPAVAHDKWYNGKEVDPITKRYCCGDNDVQHLTREEVKLVQGGYELLDTGEFIPFNRTQPSPDGEYWVFRWGGKSQCFFAPMGSS